MRRQRSQVIPLLSMRKGYRRSWSGVNSTRTFNLFLKKIHAERERVWLKRERKRERERVVWRALVAPHSLCQILWCVDSSLSRCQRCQSAGTAMCAHGTSVVGACSSTARLLQLGSQAGKCLSSSSCGTFAVLSRDWLQRSCGETECPCRKL